jgi:pyruvate formate lyase activating enzyme
VNIGGLQKLSLIDYPNRLAAIIFLQGCNMFCKYCHNPQLVYPYLFEEAMKEDDIFDFLKKRQELIEGIVISGGEPTIHRDLKDFISRIKSLGFYIKLDTNGSNPNILQELIDEKKIDFIAMDIKSPLGKYHFFYKGDIENIKKSVSIIKTSGLPHLFRTTYDKDILNDSDIKDIETFVLPSTYIVQDCRK